MVADRSRRGANLVIAGTLVLQAVAGFKLLCPPERFTSLSFLRVACNPTLWPFLEYNMYNGAHSRGEQHRRLQLFAVLDDGRRLEVRGEDFGMSHRAFHTTVVSRLAWDAPDEEASTWAQAYRTWSGHMPVAFEIERRVHHVESGDRPRVDPPTLLRRLEVFGLSDSGSRRR